MGVSLPHILQVIWIACGRKWLGKDVGRHKDAARFAHSCLINIIYNDRSDA